MTMVTRCPECSTAFKVSTEQLQARDGSVRCGRCQRVFNAFDSLTTWPDSALAAPEDEEGPDGAAAADPAAQPSGLEYPSRGDHAEMGSSSVIEEEAAALAKAPTVPLWQPPDGPEESTRTEEPLPELLFEVQEPQRFHRTWRIVVVVAALLLAFQGVYYLRTWISEVLPVTRPYLEAVCGEVGCTVPLPARSEFISIEASDLKVDAQRPNRLLLTVALRNRAPFAQRYPALELTLTGAQNQPLARRVFLPEDYVAKDRPIGAGLASNGVVDVLLPLDTADLAPTGYRLYSFYP
jgi:predicted Zn finger-like uncharacterized protein